MWQGRVGLWLAQLLNYLPYLLWGVGALAAVGEGTELGVELQPCLQLAVGGVGTEVRKIEEGEFGTAVGVYVKLFVHRCCLFRLIVSDVSLSYDDAKLLIFLDIRKGFGNFNRHKPTALGVKLQ